MRHCYYNVCLVCMSHDKGRAKTQLALFLSYYYVTYFLLLVVEHKESSDKMKKGNGSNVRVWILHN